MRERNPIHHAYINLKHNSKRRGVSFELTKEEFRLFCYETNYIGIKGKTKTTYSIDRIDPDQGYHILNIRVLKHPENCRKGSKKLVYDWRTGYATVLKLFEKIQDQREEEYPF